MEWSVIGSYFQNVSHFVRSYPDSGMSPSLQFPSPRPVSRLRLSSGSGWVAQIFCRRLVFATLGLATLMTGPGPTPRSRLPLVKTLQSSACDWLSLVTRCALVWLCRLADSETWDVIKCMIAALPRPAGSGETGNFWQKDGQICISSIGYDQITAWPSDNWPRQLTIMNEWCYKSRETEFVLYPYINFKTWNFHDSLNEQAGI